MPFKRHKDVTLLAKTKIVVFGEKYEGNPDSRADLLA